MTKKAIKGILLGNTAVGKTSFVLRANCQSIDDIPSNTGVNYIQFNMDNSDIAFNIFDTAGQEEYRAMLPSYYHGSQVVFFFTTCQEENGSCPDDNSLVFYMKDVIEHIGNYDQFIPIFILNKIDLIQDVTEQHTPDSPLGIREKQVKDLILKTVPELENNLHFYSISCRDNYMVQEALYDAFNMALDEFSKSIPAPTPELVQGPNPNSCKC